MLIVLQWNRVNFNQTDRWICFTTCSFCRVYLTSLWSWKETLCDSPFILVPKEHSCIATFSRPDMLGSYAYLWTLTWKFLSFFLKSEHWAILNNFLLIFKKNDIHICFCILNMFFKYLLSRSYFLYEQYQICYVAIYFLLYFFMCVAKKS